MSSQQLPNSSQAAEKTAANQIRIDRCADALAGHIDRLAEAAGRDDWAEVGRIGGEMAARSRAAGYRAVSALADRVCHEAQRPHNAQGVKRSVIRLIGTCGRVSPPAWW